MSVLLCGKLSDSSPYLPDLLKGVQELLFLVFVEWIGGPSYLATGLVVVASVDSPVFAFADAVVVFDEALIKTTVNPVNGVRFLVPTLILTRDAEIIFFVYRVSVCGGVWGVAVGSRDLQRGRRDARSKREVRLPQNCPRWERLPRFLPV